jgi:uncharacterized protein DUF4396
VVIPELAAALGGTTADAKWLSMNCVMVGTIPVMVILRTDFAGTTDIGSVRFWIVLSLAVLVGLTVAYPVNVWLVSNHLKHGMGTVRALGEGGQALTVGAMDMADMSPSRVTVTRTQIAAVAVLTLTALGAGMLLAAAFGDFLM